MSLNKFCVNSCIIINAVFRCDFLLFLLFVFGVLFAICLFFLCSCAVYVIRLMAIVPPH
jgi:hypothetical protein